MQYHVVYELDVNAESPEAAALQAYEAMRDLAGMPPILTVTGPDQISHDVDLETLDLETLETF